MKTLTWKQVQVGVVIVALIIGSYYIMHYTADNEPRVEALVRHIGVFGPLLLVGMYALLGASPVPSELLTVITAATFGPFIAMIVAGIGNTLAALVEYRLGTHLRNLSDFDDMRQKLPFGIGKLPVDSPVFLLAVRAIPGYAPKIVGLASGMYRVPLWRFTWTTLIPSFIGAAVFAYSGAGLLQLFK